MNLAEIYYDRNWTKDTIEQIQSEIYLLDNLEQNICDIRSLSVEAERLFCQVSPDLLALKKSFQETKKSLEGFMEAAERSLAKAEKDFEDQLEKKSELFTGM